MTNYYEILKVPRNAGPQEITSSYRYLLQHTYYEQGREAELSSLSQAYKTLTNPAKRQEYDRQLNIIAGQYVLKNPELPTEAERAYLEGLKSFERQNYQEAVQYFAKAARLEPAQGHFYSQWGLAIGMFPGRLPEAEFYCKKAIEQDPDNPEFYYNLGFLYQRHNLGEAAQQAFARAQEAQSVRQAKLGVQKAIAIPWEGDAESLLVELENLEQAVGKDAFQNEADSAAGEAAVTMVEETLPEQETEDLPKELESLETSLNGEQSKQAAAGPTEKEAEVLAEENKPSLDGQSKLVGAEAPIEETESSDLAVKAEPDGSIAVDLLKELDSIESMVNSVHHDSERESSSEIQGQTKLPQEVDSGTIESAKTEGYEPALVGMEDVTKNLEEPHPLELHEDAVSDNSIDELEQEALKLLQELNVPIDEHQQDVQAEAILGEKPQTASEESEVLKSESPSPESQADVHPVSEGGTAEDEKLSKDEVKMKLERLTQMEEQMMEELMKLKAEREKLKEALKF